MDIGQAIGRLEESSKWVEKELSEIKETQKAQDAKINTLLTWRWKIYGASAVIGIICSGLFEMIMNVLTHGK